MHMRAIWTASLLLVPAVALGISPAAPWSSGPPAPASEGGCLTEGILLPLYVDECGDTMLGRLSMAADVEIQHPHRVLFEGGGGDDGGALAAHGSTLSFAGKDLCLADAGIAGCFGGDITSVAPGFGLTGGGTAGDVSLAVNPALFQQRVSGVCASGSSIRTVNQDGAVACEPDDTSGGTVTSVATGSGLVGGPVTTAGTISIAEGGVTSAMVADGALAEADLAFNPATQAELDAHKASADHDGRYSVLGHTHDDRYYTESEADGHFVRFASGSSLKLAGDVLSGTTDASARISFETGLTSVRSVTATAEGNDLCFHVNQISGGTVTFNVHHCWSGSSTSATNLAVKIYWIAIGT